MKKRLRFRVLYEPLGMMFGVQAGRTGDSLWFEVSFWRWTGMLFWSAIDPWDELTFP